MKRQVKKANSEQGKYKRKGLEDYVNFDVVLEGA
jgi:hypothetical protein